MKDLTVLSLFDGISCGQVALERAGLTVYLYLASEINEKSIRITEKNYPDTVQLGDVRNLKSESLPDIDLLIGGSPCQGFSLAGKLLNFDDPRSKLFFEFVRLKDECKPSWWLLENVKMRKEYRDVISMCLETEPVEINSSLVSAQNRKRLYWTNIPFDLKNIKDKGLTLRDVIDGLYGEDITELFLSKKDGTLARVKADSNLRTLDDKAKCLTVGGQSISKSGATNIILDNGKIYKMSPTECERLQTLPDGYTDLGLKSNGYRYRVLGDCWTVDVVAEILKGIASP